MGTLVTWLVIVQIDNVVLIGETVMLPQLVQQQVALVLEMLLIANTSNSCKNSLVVRPLVLPLHASKLALGVLMVDPHLLMATLSRGSVAQLAQLLLGNNEVVVMIAVDMIPATLLQQEMRLHGQEIAEALVVVATTSEVKTATTLQPHHLHLGNNLLLHILLLEHQVAMLVTLLPVMVLAILKLTWAPLRDSLLLQD